MRHVDDGTVHAWLDGQVTDRAEAAWIDEHLRWCAPCAARVAGERAVIERAHALLASAAPAAEAESPSFDAIAARAAQRDTTGSDATGRPWLSSVRLLPLAWAASLVLAAGIGWFARDEAVDRAISSLDVARVAEETAPPGTDRPADAQRDAPAEGGRQAAAPSRRAAAPAATADRERQAAPELASGVAAPAASGQVPETTPQQDAAAREMARALRGAAAGAAAEAPRPALAASLPEPAGPPPVALAEPIALTQSAQQAGSAQAAAAPAAPPARQSATTAASAWRPLPRTEAAVRSGMALYGLEGMDVVLTALSPDSAAVRTVYRLQSGATIELLQERASAPSALSGVATDALARRAVPGRPAALASTAPPPRTWSEVRGDVRLSLRTGAIAEDVNAIATRLRVE